MAEKKSKQQSLKLPVPALETPDQVSATIFSVGKLRRDLLRIEAEMNDALAAAKERYENSAAPLKCEIERMLAAIRGYCDAHRKELGGEAKTMRFATGECSWRSKPAKVTLKGAKSVLAWLLERGGKWMDFVRVKHSVNKEAMLADKERASEIPGVTIKSRGENFIVKPFESELEEVA